MAFKFHKTHDRCTCRVVVSPSEVDAGTDVTVAVALACPEGCDLAGLSVSIRDAGDAEIARIQLAQGDEDGATGDVTLAAPARAGLHAYRAVLLPEAQDGIVHEAAPAEFTIVTRPHATRVSLWGLPPAIRAGDRVSFKVGVKCSAGCTLAGRPVSVVDGDGRQVAAGTLGEDHWPGTAALHFAELTMNAPDAPGQHSWQVRIPASDAEPPHQAGEVGLVLNVVGAPDCEVTVEAIDREENTPIRGARIVMHPYRAVTDESGLARLRVSRGDYKMLVSGSSYVPLSTRISVTDDLMTRAELSREPPPRSPDDGY